MKTKVKPITIAPAFQSIMDSENLTFKEMEDRWYGCVGHLMKGDKVVVIIHWRAFYVHDKNFPMNIKTLPVIFHIQEMNEKIRKEAGVWSETFG